MNQTEFLIGRDGLDLQDDFYPEDLPREWRFDYYSTLFKALCLPIDTDEDLDEIFTALEEFEGEFELVISIQQVQLLNIKTLSSLLKPLLCYQAQFILFCQIDKQPNDAVMACLSDYQVCFQSVKKLPCKLNHKSILSQHLFFNHLPVFYSAGMMDEKQMRTYLEEISSINTKTILVCKHAESEALSKMRIISELLGF